MPMQGEEENPLGVASINKYAFDAAKVALFLTLLTMHASITRSLTYPVLCLEQKGKNIVVCDSLSFPLWLPIPHLPFRINLPFPIPSIPFLSRPATRVKIAYQSSSLRE
jgi:hypothetical protein